MVVFLVGAIIPYFATGLPATGLARSYVQAGVSDPTSNVGSTSANETVTTSLSSERDLAFILLSAETVESMRSSIELIRRRGGEILHIFPTHVLVGRISRSLRDTLIGTAGIEQVEYSVVDPSTVARYGETAIVAAEAWNNNYMGLAKEAGLEPPHAFQDPGPIINDTKTAPLDKTQTWSAPPYGAGFYDTSEYMMGDVVVAIIFPESNGAIDVNQETWSGSQLSNSVSEIQAGLGWWAAREPNAMLSFTYVTSVTATSYEPIRRPQADEYLWIGEVMSNKGYSTGYYFDRVRAYLNDLRVTYDTDWAVAIFVVNDYWDLDNQFADGYFAYAYLGGPFLVMTYSNDGYGIANMDAVTTHEFGHSFYALDQYTSAQQPCTKRSGYLNVENQNSAYPSEGSCLSNVPSIMRGGVSPYTQGAIDVYARMQVGWRDADADGVFDILDFFPQNVLNPYSPDPTTNQSPSYSGYGSSQATYPNTNPYGTGNRITINVITSVYFWVEDTNGNVVRSSLLASAGDGAFNSAFENYGFTIAPALSPGTYKIATVAWNQQGMGLISWDWLTITQPVTVTKTATVTSTVSSTSYTTRYTTSTLTSYTSTYTSTSTIPTVTTVVLVPLTVTSTVQSTQYLTPILTTTVTSYTGTQASTSTVLILTTVVLVPFTSTSTVQSTQYVTSTRTTTATSYTSTCTSMGTVVVTTTITEAPTVTVTSTVPLWSTEYVTSTRTTTATSYTATTTSTSTMVVYTTVTASPGGAGAGASSSLAYLGFISLLAVIVGHRVTATKAWRIMKVRSRMERRCSTS